MKKEDLKEFTLEQRVCGPTRTVQFTTGDVLVTGDALILHGVSAADAWQILGMLDRGLFNEGDVELEGDAPKVEKVEKPKKKKGKSKAQKKAEEKADAAPPPPPKSIKPKEKEKKPASNGAMDLERFKSATGLRELVGDFKEAGVETKEQVIEYCEVLKAGGLRCLKGVNIERRVANLWDMVA